MVIHIFFIVTNDDQYREHSEVMLTNKAKKNQMSTSFCSMCHGIEEKKIEVQNGSETLSSICKSWFDIQRCDADIIES